MGLLLQEVMSTDRMELFNSLCGHNAVF